MTTTTDLRDDAAYLREMSEDAHPSHRPRYIEIAEKLEAMANVMFTPTLTLEGRVEEALAKNVSEWLDNGRDKFEGEVAALWLLSRRVKGAGNKGALSAGLAGLGAAMGAALVSDNKKGSD